MVELYTWRYYIICYTHRQQKLDYYENMIFKLFENIDKGSITQQKNLWYNLEIKRFERIREYLEKQYILQSSFRKQGIK